MKTKDLSIETLRGLAILLVVAGYTITEDITRAVHTDMAAAGLRYFHYLLTPIRMPLFTVISAYLYASSPAAKSLFKKLVLGKARRIMIPFLAVSTIQFVICALLPMQNHPMLSDLYRVYIWPHEQLWFLYSIFEIFVIVGALDALKLLRTFSYWAVWLTVSIVTSIVFDPPRAFSLHGINYLMPYFLMGYGLRRYPEKLLSPIAIRGYMVITAAAGVLWSGLYIKPVLTPALHHATGLLLSFSAVPLILYFRFTIPFFARIGYYAFGIHLFNRIGISVLRTVFEHSMIRNTALQFISYIVFGVGFAVLLQLFFEKFAVSRKFILGLREAPAAARTEREVIRTASNAMSWGAE